MHQRRIVIQATLRGLDVVEDVIGLVLGYTKTHYLLLHDTTTLGFHNLDEKRVVSGDTFAIRGAALQVAHVVGHWVILTPRSLRKTPPLPVSGRFNWQTWRPDKPTPLVLTNTAKATPHSDWCVLVGGKQQPRAYNVRSAQLVHVEVLDGEQPRSVLPFGDAVYSLTKTSLKVLHLKESRWDVLSAALPAKDRLQDILAANADTIYLCGKRRCAPRDSGKVQNSHSLWRFSQSQRQFYDLTAYTQGRRVLAVVDDRLVVENRRHIELCDLRGAPQQPSDSQIKVQLCGWYPGAVLL